ncbi:hypothetical protein Tco_1370779 [Tanacetum coccineum]
MACALPHTDSEVEALVQKLINEDKGRQDVLLNLAFQFEDSCAIRDDLRKTYERCNDISQESHALICTLLRESSKNDRKLHLSMYRKSSQLQKQMDAKSKEFHQLRMDEEAIKEMLEEEAMNKKAQEEKIRQAQVENNAFFLEFGVVRYDSECLGGLGSFEFVHDPQHVCSQHHLPLSVILRSYFLQQQWSPVVRLLGVLYLWCLHEEYAGSPSENDMASGKNGDDGDLLLFWDGPGACDISAGALSLFISLERSHLVVGVKVTLVQVIGSPERLASQLFLEQNVSWRLLVLGSCQRKTGFGIMTSWREEDLIREIDLYMPIYQCRHHIFLILFGTIPTTIPDTTLSVIPPTTHIDTTPIPTISHTIPPSPDYTRASPDYSLASDTEFNPSKDPSSDHIPPLPATSPFLSSADESSDSDIPDTPPSPTHGTPFNETTLSTQRSLVASDALRRRVMVLAPGQPIPHGR